VGCSSSCILDGFKESSARIDAKRERYKSQFDQESVLRVDDPRAARVSFWHQADESVPLWERDRCAAPARYASPMPPAPIGPAISYGPNCEPEGSGMRGWRL